MATMQMQHLAAEHTLNISLASLPAAEWQEQGRKLFDSKRFSQAKLCYERAYMPHEAAVSHAYHLREEASRMPHSHRREIAARRTAFLQAAATFLGCARNERAKNAAEAYFRRAGKCFEDAGDFNQAIDAYNHAKDFNRVAGLYRDMGKIDQAVATVKNHDRDINPNVAQRVISVMGNIDQAVATVKNHDRDINPNVAQRVIGVARLFYFKKGQFE
jgi:tetratricopeptide (TPR) repeat protein